jgi:hypothetical protein
LGWTEGHFTRTGPGVRDTGHYMTVWVKEQGRWKVRADWATPIPKSPERQTGFTSPRFLRRQGNRAQSRLVAGQRRGARRNWLNDKM